MAGTLGVFLGKECSKCLGLSLSWVSATMSLNALEAHNALGLAERPGEGVMENTPPKYATCHSQANPSLLSLDLDF